MGVLTGKLAEAYLRSMDGKLTSFLETGEEALAAALVKGDPNPFPHIHTVLHPTVFDQYMADLAGEKK